MPTTELERTPNLALQWLSNNNIAATEVDCVEIAGALVADHGGHMLWIDGPLQPLFDITGNRPLAWSHHAAAVIGGLVHCPWVGDPLPIAEYLAALFDGHPQWELIPGDDDESPVAGTE